MWILLPSGMVLVILWLFLDGTHPPPGSTPASLREKS